ncbi:MAG TPA: NAD(P)-dependent oxidoreductase, partial [Chloroflexota bacterium]|nr:NAD(P)-dependent oxidoreductase [Chloroflexota bacterium]
MAVTTVAFIGLGAMGSGMAQCLVRRGLTVRGYDTRHARLDELAEFGVTPTRSSAEAAEGADAAVVIVLTADQAEDAVFGDLGLARSLRPGSVVVCSSTMAPARARSLAARAGEAGLRWLDAPVSGGTVRAADGTLTTMVGADAADLELARPMLQAFSRDVFHLGPVGAGSTAKMVNQVLVFCNLAATAEAMTLCRKLGVDLQSVYDVISTAMGTSAIFESRVPKLIDGSYASGGSMRIALKDLGIVEEAARELSVPMPMTSQATQLFRAAAASGELDGDDLAV